MNTIIMETYDKHVAPFNNPVVKAHIATKLATSRS